MGHDGTPHLALDTAGNPWISDYSDDDARPRLIHRVGSTWVKETFAADDPRWRPTAVSRDPSGNAALVYLGNPDHTLRMATPSAGVWAHETIDQLDGHGDVIHGAHVGCRP